MASNSGRLIESHCNIGDLACLAVESSWSRRQPILPNRETVTLASVPAL